MATVIILNVVFAALVAGAILTLLTWGISSDRRTLDSSGRRGAARFPVAIRHSA